MYSFEYRGGAKKSEEHTNEKFMLFFIVAGKEVPLYQMLREGYAIKPEWNKDMYETEFRYAKIFVSQKGFGIQSRFYSFYVKGYPVATPCPIVTIRPFSLEKTDFLFRTKCSFLQKDVVLEILEDDNPSKSFVARQGILPTDILKAMVTVDRTQLRKGVRGVRL